MNKNILITLFFSFSFFLAICQPTIQWQKPLGGTAADHAYSIQQTNDGGYIVAGRSASINADVSGNHGDVDFWVVKLTNSGIIEWQKSLGGAGKAGEAMIEWGQEKHHAILKYIEKAMKFIPGYSKLDKKTQEQVAEVVHIVVVAYLALNSGGATVAAAKSGNLGLTGVEGALTAVKSGEVGTFLSARLATIIGSKSDSV